jgi:hypothetical protein
MLKRSAALSSQVQLLSNTYAPLDADPIRTNLFFIPLGITS